MSDPFIKTLFKAAIRSVQAGILLPGHLRADPDSITIAGRKFPEESRGKLVLIACGKAAAAMASEASLILGYRISESLCITKHGHSLPVKGMDVFEAGHPYPDEHSFSAGSRVMNLAGSLQENDLVLLLLSGGASSLLADCPDGCTPEDIIKLNHLLVNSGAGIHEINSVRKHVSRLKGGHLSGLIYPAVVCTLILSDVPGDHPEDIASGPTSPDPTRFEDALAVLDRYKLLPLVPESVVNHLKKGLEGVLDETPKPGHPLLSRSYNFVIGSNKTALQAASTLAQKAGFHTYPVPETLEGDVEEAARVISAQLAAYQGPLPCCFLWGGETTLRVSGTGYGGRNQHLALSILLELKNKWQRRESFTLLCGATDGTDGPTDAAGAIIVSEMLMRPDITPSLMKSFLDEFNSNAFFSEQGTLLYTGPTQTNVMDIVLAIIEPAPAPAWT